ncbi:hypothetical protein Tco_1450571, partial [Tanacetum coccineum]
MPHLTRYSAQQVVVQYTGNGYSTKRQKTIKKDKTEHRIGKSGKSCRRPSKRSWSAFGYSRSAGVDYAFSPLVRCKEVCHNKTVAQTCCNQEHDGSRSKQYALRT